MNVKIKTAFLLNKLKDYKIPNCIKYTEIYQNNFQKTIYKQRGKW